MLSRVEVRAPPPPPILKIAFCAYLVGKKQFRFFPLFRFLDRQARCRLGTVDLAFPLRSPETVLPASFPLPPRGASDQGVPWPRVGQTVVSRPRSESSSRRLTAPLRSPEALLCSGQGFVSGGPSCPSGSVPPKSCVERQRQ